MTTATLPRRIFRPMATPPAPRSFLIGFVATLVAGLVALLAASAAIGLTGEGEVPSNVRVGGVDVAGLDREAARARLEEALPSLDAGTAVVTAGGEVHEVTYAELGRRYDFDAMLDAALGVARGDDPITDGIERLRTLARPTELPLVAHAFDPDALATAAERIARAVSQHPVEARVERDGFAVVPGANGRVLDASAVAAAVGQAVDSTDPADVAVNLAVASVEPVVSTEEAELAAEEALATAARLRLTLADAVEGEEPFRLSRATIASWITFGPLGERDYAMQLDRRAATAAVQALAADIDREAVSARFGVAGAGLGGVIPGQTGRTLDVAASADGVLATLAERASGGKVPSLALTVDVTEPSLTTAQAAEILPQMRLVSSWTTNYVPGDGNGFGNNISIPAWDLDGYNLAPGEWFSFWGGIGPVSTDRGYRYGGAIINGRSVAQGALAGGICSTSTTLFNAAMRFGLEIGERENHYYYIDRYPTGLDATVAIVDSSVTDMTFRNDTEHPIVIRGFGSPGQVTFQLWSVPNGRTVALSNPVISDARAAIETTQLDTSMAPGTSRRVEYPHDGFNVSVSRTVYGPGGEVIHQNTWFSDYRAVNGITLVGPTPAEPDPPADEDEGDTAGDGTGDPPDEPRG